MYEEEGGANLKGMLEFSAAAHRSAFNASVLKRCSLAC